jgi:uncharacterized damage-inducible protein DinB
MTTQALTGERADLLQSLARSRYFLRNTTRGLTDEQAAQRTTASELCLGGLIKHVTLTERQWIRFIQEGPSAMAFDESSMGDWMSAFQMLPGETLAGLLADYDRCAEQTAEVAAGLPDLDASQPLPEAPWFEPGARWSARRVLLHVIAEIAQHAGHADIIRESLDGAKSMG